MQALCFLHRAFFVPLLKSARVPKLKPNPNQLLKPFLKKFWLRLVLANLAAIGLGIVTAFFGVLLGPIVQVLGDDSQQNKMFLLKDLIGKSYADLATYLNAPNQLSYDQILNYLPYLILVTAFFRLVFQVISWYVFERTGEEISLHIRDRLANAFISFPAQTRITDKAGQKYEEQLSTAMTIDVKVLREYFAHFYGGIPREIIQVCLLTVNLIVFSPFLFLLFILGVAPIGILISRYGKRLKGRFSKALDNYSELTEWIQQRLLGIETIKHYHSEDYEAKKMGEITDALYIKLLRALRVKARIAPITEATSIIVLSGVLYIALKEVASGTYSGAIIFNFFSSLAILSQSATKLSRYFNHNREGSAAVQRLEKLINYYENPVNAVTDVKTFESRRELIRCQNINFSYENSPQQNNKLALNDFSYTFEKGKFYCIYGHTGSGKSTLLNLLLQNLTPHSGNISYNSTVAKSDSFAFVPQKILLAPTTVAGNLSYPKELNLGKSIEARMLDALDKAGLKQTVLSLPQQLNTLVGSEGRDLSGGQKQRLMLARVFYLNLELNFIDEGTSAVDPELEKQIFEHLKDFVARGHTIIMIAHRAIAAQYADEILLLEDGKIKVSGASASIVNLPEFTSLTHSSTATQ